MRKAALTALAAAALAAGGTVRAQTPAPPAANGSAAGQPVGEVVVKGEMARPPASFSRAVQGFVASSSQPSPVGTLSRWMSPVCPSVVGMTRPYAEFLIQRIGDIAARAGAPRGKCARSNVRIVFTAQPQQLMDYVRAKEPDLLGYHFATQEKVVGRFQEPIDAWHITRTRDEAGGSHIDDPYNQKDPAVAKGGSYVVGSSNASRLVGAASSDFKFALVVVDSARVGKQPLGRIADQVAMLVLTNPRRPKACSPLPSLLDSLDPACPASATVAAMTPYDEAFLKALYSTDPQEKLALERGEIARRVGGQGPPQ